LWIYVLVEVKCTLWCRMRTPRLLSIWTWEIRCPQIIRSAMHRIKGYMWIRIKWIRLRFIIFWENIFYFGLKFWVQILKTFSYNSSTEESVDSAGNIVKDSNHWVLTPDKIYSTSDKISTFNGHISSENHYNSNKKTHYKK